MNPRNYEASLSSIGEASEAEDLLKVDEHGNATGFSDPHQ